MNTNENGGLPDATTVARKTPRDLWSRILFAVGGIAMLIGGLDPLEGSLLILPGSGLMALSTYLGQAERRVIACKVWAFILVAIGVGALWGLSMVGGLGGSSGRSNWWGVLILPYLIGWSMGIWGPGSPRWLTLLGIGVGLWYLNLAFVARGVVGIVCGILGVLTIGGCIYRLRSAMKAKAVTMLAGAGIVVAAIVGVLAWQPAKAKPPVRETYVRKFDAPTTVNGMTVVGPVEFYKTNSSVTFARLATNAVMWGQPLPAGTGIHFTPDGKPDWCFLPKDHAIKGHLFRRGAQLDDLFLSQWTIRKRRTRQRRNH